MGINTEYSILYFIFSSAAAILISYLYYRKVKLSSPSKLLLISLRASGSILILILIFIVFILSGKSKTEKPINIFLTDNSGSITLEKRSEKRDETREMFKSLENNSAENKYYRFSDGILTDDNNKENPDTNAILSEGNTDLTKSIESLIRLSGGRKISTINIISDGIFNEGGNPLQSALQSGAMFNYFLIGDTVQKKDFVLKNVFFNKSSYTGSSTQIIAEINSYGVEKTLNVNLFEDDVLVQSRDIQVVKDKVIYNTEFRVTSTAEGIRKYKIEIDKDIEEITDKNNEEEFFIEYLSNKFRLLVISGNPSPDFSYIKESITASENFEAQYFTQKSENTFYEGQFPSLEGYHTIIAVNFPTSATGIGFLENLKSSLDKNRIPMFFISGSNTDYERAKIIDEFLPFNISGSSGTDGKSSVKFINDINRKDNKWLIRGRIPDIFIPGTSLVPKEGTKTVFYSEKYSKPVLIYSETEERNSAAFLGYGIYKWRLNETGTESRNLFGNIVKNIILSISDKEKSKKIFLNYDRQVYRPGERMRLSGQVNSDENTGNRIISMQIFNDKVRKELKDIIISGRSFYSETDGLKKGEYSVMCTLTENGIISGSDMKKIIIKESGKEYKITLPDKGILQDLATKTGGSRITGENLSEVRDRISGKNKSDELVSHQENKIYPNSSLIFLILIILIFSAEWFARKRLNLP
ncbi:MAG: hypothetical protein HY959_12645 [Ignavibacteriae bacterium]|nr:hypothetical protein [Ignavibacteriota bacterium]